MIGIFGFASSAFAADWSLPGITIVTRAQWWADEAIRFTNTPYAQRKAIQKQKTEEELQELKESNYDKYLEKEEENMIADSRNNYLISNYADEQKVNNSIYLYGVNNLSWPQSYHYQKNKIIVHHTAGDTSTFTGVESAIGYMKEVYEYHTSKWGDIGYNFLIDPYGNIYEGRAGGDSVIWAHATWNNTPSIWISLMGNFEIQKPTDAQIKSLTALVTALAKKYNIDPLAKTDYHTATTTEPYMKSKTNYRLAGHRDAGVTACPGKNLYAQLGTLRQAVRANLQNGVLVKSVSVQSVSSTGNSVVSLSSWSNPRSINTSLLKGKTTSFSAYLDSLKKIYSKKNGINSAKTSTVKVTDKISIETAKDLMAGNINVLLYDVSMKYTKRDISCTNSCAFIVGKKMVVGTTWMIQKTKNIFTLIVNGKKYAGTNISVKDNKDELVSIQNYDRVSYAKVPRNTFYGSLFFSNDLVRNLSTNRWLKQTVVVNSLPFMKYIRGIAETNDSESPAKIRAMQLISKWYALFYLTAGNKHTSIPKWASYNAIDNPNSFQKYVGAGLEKTLTRYYQELETTQNQLVVYKWYVPILPYFSCSAWFTRSGKEKRGWSDTPYVVSKIDPVSCDKFEGHWVGLSGKWAQYLALQWWTTEEILKYYYPGVEITNIDN